MPVELRGNPGLICKGSTRLGLLSQVGFTAQVVLHWQPFVRSSVFPDLSRLQICSCSFTDSTDIPFQPGDRDRNFLGAH
jgi:hypothetical protein